MEKKERKFTRALSVNNLFSKKAATFNTTGWMKPAFGTPEKSGAWLIYGGEKNGKTWLALMIANKLSELDKVHYISAEQGLSNSFSDACKRAQLSHSNKRIKFSTYEPLVQLYERLRGRNAPQIVLIDNITFYVDELKNGAVRRLLSDFPKVLFIFLAHEEKGEPYTATAKLVKRLAEVIMHVEGLNCKVSGRCPGGNIVIDPDKAALIHGQSILN